MSPLRPDLAVGAAGLTVGLGAAAVEGLGASGALMGAALGGALGLARTQPAAAWVAAALSFLGLSATTNGVEVPFAHFFLIGFHALAAGRFVRGLPASVLAVAGLLGAALGGAAIEGSSGVPALFIPLMAWGAGRAVREHALMATRLADRAAELEAEREAHAQLSVRYERARIASELHDIVAHAISVMVVQASAGQRLVTADPDLAREAFGAIGDAARQAEQDMGRLVELLANREEADPAPDLGLVEELVRRAAGSGLDVSLRLEGERAGLAPEVVQVAYRVVQESLTNAMRYAAGASVAVRVRGEARALLVEIVNAPAAGTAAELSGHGTGSGLQGLHDRVGALGGSFAADPTFGGGWEVRAQIPKSGVPSHA